MDAVLLLHGIFRTFRSMRSMERFLIGQGFSVLNQGYPSTRYSLEQLAEMIHPFVEAFTASQTGRMHCVGYSMGGLLLRVYLQRYRPARLGRVVMLGTPNHGSEVADWVNHWWLYKKLYGPAGQELVTSHVRKTRIPASVDYELGIIAGNRPLDVVGSRIIGMPNDGKVSVESTKLEGMKEHVVIPVNHTYMPQSRKAWRLVAQFLRSGSFASMQGQSIHDVSIATEGETG